MNQKFLIGLLGTNDPNTFLNAFFFALIGAALSLFLQGMTRNPDKAGSPVEFSWGYFLRDNAKRLVTALLLIFVGLRFMPEIIGVQIGEARALLLGLGLDKFAQKLKQWGTLGEGAKG